MTRPPLKIDLVFYRSDAGKEPVRDWLLGLDQAGRHKIGLDLMRVQFAWPVGMPLVRPLGGGLFEARTNLADKTISRVLFCFHDRSLFALHGVIKKSQKLPAEDLKLARQRQKEVENG